MSANPKAKTLEVVYTASKTAARFHNSPAFVRGIRGPIGSGKSVACCFELFRLACEQRPGPDGVRRTRMVVVRNTLPELKSTTIKTWLDWFPDGDPKKDKSKFGVFSKSSPWTHHVRYGLADGTLVEMEVIFLALDTADDAKKLLSLECTAIWYNEAREIPKEIIDAGTGRVGRYPSVKMGGCTRKAIIMDTNPPDDQHWWAELEEETPGNWEFFLQPGGLEPDAENLENLNQPENWRLLTLEERREHGRGYYLDMLGGKSQDWIDVMINNQLGSIQKGVPVYASCWNKDIHVPRAPIILIPRALITIGVDSSGRHPAAVFLQHAGRGRVQAVRELCIMDDEGMGAERYARYLVEKTQRWFPGANIDEFWGDPAGGAKSQNDERTYFDILNAELKAYNLRMKPSPGLRFPERVEAVEHFLSTLVDGHPMLEISSDCLVLIRGFNGKYMFKEINTAGGGTRVDDRPVKNRESNPQDGLQYALCGLRARGDGFRRNRAPKKIHYVSPKGSIF